MCQREERAMITDPPVIANMSCMTDVVPTSTKAIVTERTPLSTVGIATDRIEQTHVGIDCNVETTDANEQTDEIKTPGWLDHNQQLQQEASRSLPERLNSFASPSSPIVSAGRRRTIGIADAGAVSPINSAVSPTGTGAQRLTSPFSSSSADLRSPMAGAAAAPQPAEDNDEELQAELQRLREARQKRLSVVVDGNNNSNDPQGIRSPQKKKADGSPTGAQRRTSSDQQASPTARPKESFRNRRQQMGDSDASSPLLPDVPTMTSGTFPQQRSDSQIALRQAERQRLPSLTPDPYSSGPFSPTNGGDDHNTTDPQLMEQQDGSPSARKPSLRRLSSLEVANKSRSMRSNSRSQSFKITPRLQNTMEQLMKKWGQE